MAIHTYKKTKLACCLLSITALLYGCGGSGSSSGANTSTDTSIPAGHSVSDAEADSRANSMLAQLTLAQKIDIVHGHGSPVGQLGYIGLNYPSVPGAMDLAVGYVPGIDAIGLPENNMVDASSGVTAEGLQATSLPATVALASTWSPDIAYAYGSRIGLEARTLGFTTALGGGVNLIRDPRNGRGFEYLGEDPILAGELAAKRTIGVQENKILSTIKHFAFNDIETNRMIGNSVVDEQTMRETELLAFEIAITKGKPAYVMCAFNQVNGQYACENDYLLNQVLKGEWGYQGMVMSDWGAQSSTIDAALNGLDEEQPGQDKQDTEIPYFMSLYMGGPWFIDDLADAVTNGDVPLSRLNDMVFRKIRSMIAMGVVDEPPQAPGDINESAGNVDAKAFADASIILLQNKVPANAEQTSKVLPAKAAEINSIVVVGNHADKGVLSGGGSGGAAPLIENQVDECGQLPISPYPSCPTYIGVSPLTAIEEEYPNATVTYFEGDDADAAADAAANADLTLIFAGAWFSEGTDNADMKLSSPANNDTGVYTYDQDALIATVAAKAKRSVVVLETGQPVLMPWVDKVDGIINAWYPGVRGAYAIADIISGDVNPSAKLPVTFPKAESDLVATSLPTNLGTFLGATVSIKSLASYIKYYVDLYLGDGAYDYLRQVFYTEKLAWNGYKWMDKNNIEPLFAFGHGLSYSTFTYSDVSASETSDGDVDVSFTIANTSDIDGTEIAEVYVSLPDNVPGNEQPPKRLAGFSRVSINAHDSSKVTVSIPRKYISTWDVDSQAWITTSGSYTFTVADTSALADTTNVLTTSITIN